MTVRGFFPDDLGTFIGSVTTAEPEAVIRLREETSKLPAAGMQIGEDQTAFMTLMAKLIGARRAIEIGTFTGMSAIAVAQALPPDGELICCDVNEEWTSIAKRYWTELGLADRITLRLAPAALTLDALIDNGDGGTFDLAFIDADKTGYDTYYEKCLTLMRPGGLILLDNMLWHGRVADSLDRDEDTVALRTLSEKIGEDDRVDSCLASIGDGVMIARKK
ncbi:putative O-methyltransferase YrrM [Parvibaculum indicum]|uniref:O-methyltransferase n=1 Tax=Parvibaculum indicum TaxID=562969 RepID=UPI00141FF035|nr:class I SAM-dependent methyltransferase [Parvibaculum indicum]NIJ41315.1 putative O-methyltransferase YrrM [Parvibaculum indicum]